MVSTLILIYLVVIDLDIQWKQTVQHFRLLIQRYAQFWVFRKGSGNSFSTTFPWKIFVMLHSINWPNLIVSMLLLFEILGSVFTAIVCFPGYYVIHFETNLIFLTKPFFYMTKKSRQKFKYPENEKSFSGEIKSICHDFERAFSCQKLCKTWECTFNVKNCR